MSEQRLGDTEGRRSMFDWLSDLFSGEPEDRDDFLEVVKDAAERRIVDADATSIIFGAIQVSEMQARDIMIPRSQLVHLKDDDSLAQILETVILSKHSRFPVVDDDLDDVKGILHAKDLLPFLAEDERPDFDIKDYMRQATVIPESKRLNVLLQEFRAARNHMALVVDEYGNVSGAVTIEDVLEQIVGEIEDEHDVHDDGFIKPLGDGLATVKATTPVEDFNAYYGKQIDEGEFDTVGGVVLKAFGHMPKVGERIVLDELEFEVLNADAKRLRLLRVNQSA